MIKYLALALILSALMVAVLRYFEAVEKPLLIDGANVTRADFSVCATVNPGPLRRRTRPVLNPYQSGVV